jgi:hypothetical protein
MAKGFNSKSNPKKHIVSMKTPQINVLGKERAKILSDHEMMGMHKFKPKMKEDESSFVVRGGRAPMMMMGKED